MKWLVSTYGFGLDATTKAEEEAYLDSSRPFCPWLAEIMSDADELFDLRNAFYTGNYPQCIKEAQRMKVRDKEDPLKKGETNLKPKFLFLLAV